MKRKALICGIGGQDGAYLAKLLVSKNYDVYGSSRDPQKRIFSNLKSLNIYNKIQVLSSGRLPIDVLRTLSHEWIHEFQTQKLGVDDSKQIQDIGGPEENMCNVLTGIFIKQFEQNNPEFDGILYNE